MLLRTATLTVAILTVSVTALADNIVINDRYPIRGPNGTPTLSPPHVDQTHECATHVYVDSFVPHATIRVYLNGVTLIGGPVAPKFAFGAITLTQTLHTGDKITATQEVNGVVSAPSAPPMIVAAMPASLPPPVMDPKIYACGEVAPVHGLISGVKVEVQDETTGTTIGMGSTPNDWGNDWDPVGVSALVAGHQIRARQSACTGPVSAYSPAVSVLAEPSPLAAPVLDAPIVNNDTVTAHDLYTGALLQIFDHANPVGGGLATGSDNYTSISPAVSASSIITANQKLCHQSPTSTPIPPTTTIPPPQLLGPICTGQAAAYVAATTINATLVLLKNGTVAGYGGAAPGDVPLDIAPPFVFATGDTVQVAEYIDGSVALSNVVTVGCTDVTTYHNDSQRTGWNPKENTLNTSNVRPATFGHIVTTALDDQVDTQPLIVGEQNMGDLGTHEVAYVTTESNTVYAIDGWTGAILRSRNLGAPVPKPLNCMNNGPNVGINGTGTIDLGTRTLYVIAYTKQGGTPTYQLHALDLATLNDKGGSPVTVDPSQDLHPTGSVAFNATVQRQRAAMLEANGRVYAGFGSFCDFNASQSRGWLVGWNKSSLAPVPGKELTDRLATSNSADCTWPGNHPCFLSSIWMSGYGVAADPAGSIYFTTGNSAEGTYDSTYNIAESAVKMSADLTTVSGFFTPANVNSLDHDDNDYGSGGLMVLPDQPGNFPHLAVASGKDGRLFVLNRDNMGGHHATDFPQNVGIGDCWCGPSYFGAGGGAGPLGRVVSSGGGQVKLWSITANGSPVRPNLSLVATSPSLEASDQDGGFFTSVSSNGTTANTAIIWAVGRAAGTDKHVTLYAFNATPSGSWAPLLWSGVAGSWPNSDGNSNIVPTAANGRVYVASNKQLQIFGLRSSRMRMASGLGQFWGRVKSIDGDRLLLDLRSGQTLQVDLSAAIKDGHASVAGLRQPMMVEGTMRPDGVFVASLAMRAKGPALWGEDHEQ
jgi:hypothetical protein